MALVQAGDRGRPPPHRGGAAGAGYQFVTIPDMAQPCPAGATPVAATPQGGAMIEYSRAGLIGTSREGGRIVPDRAGSYGIMNTCSNSPCRSRDYAAISRLEREQSSVTPPDGLTSISFTDRVNRLNAGLLRDGIPVSDMRRRPGPRVAVRRGRASWAGRSVLPARRASSRSRGRSPRSACRRSRPGSRDLRYFLDGAQRTFAGLALRSGADRGHGRRRGNPAARSR